MDMKNLGLGLSPEQEATVRDLTNAGVKDMFEAMDRKVDLLDDPLMKGYLEAELQHGFLVVALTNMLRSAEASGLGRRAAETLAKLFVHHALVTAFDFRKFVEQEEKKENRR
jgi:hypothetical protein